MYAIANIILAEIDWYYIIGPIAVYIYIELKGGGTGGFGGSDDGFGWQIYGGVLVSTLCWKMELQAVVETYFKNSK